MGREATGAVTPRSYFQDKDLTTVHAAQNINLLVCKGRGAEDNLTPGAAVPPALLTSWEGWRRIKWAKHHQDLPQTGCRARRASLFFLSCSTACFVARKGLCIAPHLCASLARTPRARGLGCKGQFEAQPLVPGLQRATRVTPAAFSSLPSCCILRLKERFCSRTCSSPLAPGKAQGN